MIRNVGGNHWEPLGTSKFPRPTPTGNGPDLPALIRRCGGAGSPKAKLPVPKPGAMRPGPFLDGNGTQNGWYWMVYSGQSQSKMI